MRRYNSFLLRHWSLPAGRERIEVRHFQSESQAMVDNLAEAAAWIAAVTREVQEVDVPNPHKEESMAIGIYFHPQAMNAQQYDEIIRRLQTAGAGTPKGRLDHICFGSGDSLQVFDVWDSQANFDAFGATLMPILQEVGVDPGQPSIEPVHNTIPG